ncbi:MAG: hypothetical protein IKI45_09145 [Oscillospiraceae bacterium]|nr:hypothetical protein [Oscillospiraceae bacterium]
MKQLRHLISVLFAAMITLCFSITAFADEINYDIDFTREEAYAAVMNTTPTQARWLYGGKEAYYEALSDDDKEQLFEMIWNLTVSGILYEDVGKNETVHLDSFTDDYFKTVIYAFGEAKDEDEGLSNLRTRIDEINAEYLSDTADLEKVEIVEKTEPEETQLSKPDVTTAVITMEETQPPTTLYTTTAPWSEPKKNNHTALIVILCLLAVGAAAGIGYYVRQTKKTK